MTKLWFDNFQTFLNKRSMNRRKSLAIHRIFFFARKHACVLPSGGITVKDSHVNTFTVIDVVKSKMYPFEVILKYYDESTSEI